MSQSNTPNRMTALGLLEQMRRSNASREPEFNPISATLRERRAGPTAPLFGGQRQTPLPIPPRPPAVIPPQQTQQAAPQAAAAPQARTPAQALPVPPRPPQLGADGNPIPPALLPQVPGAEPMPMHERFNPENPYVATAIQMAERYNLPRNVFLSVINQESRFRPDAVSRVGALGPGQLMPGTARDMGVDPRDPMQNIEGSARYLRSMLDLHKGDMPLALASYNAGPGRVQRAGNTIPNIPETQKYVPEVLRNAGVPGYAEGGLAHLEQKYSEGGPVASLPTYDINVRANRIRTPRRPAPREELTADQLNDMVLDRIAGRAAAASESAVAAEARDRIGRAMGYAEGGWVRDPDYSRMLELLRAVDPELSVGGSGIRMGNARIVGYGGTAGVGIPLGGEGARLDTSITGQGMSSRGGGRNRQHNRVEGVDAGYTTPSGDRFTIGFHDRLMALPDTLPGANPMEVERGLSPSRGVRVGFRREFAEGGLADLHQKYVKGGEVISDEEYDRRLLERMKRDTGRTTESTNAEQARALRSAGYDAAQLASDIFLPQSPLDAALMVALGPGGRMARLAGSTALMAMEPSEAEAGGLRRLIRAYHGSPHEFAAERLIRRPGGETEFMVGATDRLPDVPEGAEVLRDYPLGRLRMDKIGTGTGAQAYTHGLYLGEAEDTARNIRDKLSQPSSGRIYEVDIDASPDRLMDWYLPRSQQPGPVQEALRSLGSRIPEETPIYGAMNRSRRNSLFAGDVIGADTATPAEVSDRLREAGIQGLTYLEPGSRTAEIAPRSRNYVIYDPEIIDITRRYAQGGLAQLEHKYAEGGAVSAQPAIYDPDAVNTLANQIEAGYV